MPDLTVPIVFKRRKLGRFNRFRSSLYRIKFYKGYLCVAAIALIYFYFFFSRTPSEIPRPHLSSNLSFRPCTDFQNATVFMTSRKSDTYAKFRDEYTRIGWQLTDRLETTTQVIGPFPMPGRNRKFDDDDVWKMLLRLQASADGETPRCVQLANVATGLYNTLFPKERMHQLAGNQEFLHRTFLLSDLAQKNAFLRQLECVNPDPSQNVWMFKPYSSGQGRGMFFESDYMVIRKMLLSSPKHDPCVVDESYQERLYNLSLSINIDPDQYLVQEYETRPMLVNKRKFHFRTLALMACDEPTLVLYHDSYIFLSSKEYDLSTNDMSVHLSNTHIQKDVEGVDMRELFWTMDEFQDYINDNNIVKKGVNKMSSYVEDVLIPEMKSHLRQAILIARQNLIDTHHARIHKFRMLAPDFMLDEDLNLKLIEINISGGLPDYNITKKREMQQDYIQDIVSVVDRAFHRRLENQNFHRMDLGHWQVILDTS